MYQTVGTGVVDLQTGVLERSDGREHLPERELTVLRVLCRAQGQPVDVDDLAQQLAAEEGVL